MSTVDRERARGFDAWAGEYDRFRPGYPDELFGTIAARLGLPERPLVVDLGAGTGRAALAMAERGWQIDPASPEVQALIAYLKRQGTVIDPTASLFEDDLLGKPGKPFPNIAPVFDRLPPVVQRSSRGGALAKTPRGRHARYPCSR